MVLCSQSEKLIHGLALSFGNKRVLSLVRGIREPHDVPWCLGLQLCPEPSSTVQVCPDSLVLTGQEPGGLFRGHLSCPLPLRLFPCQFPRLVQVSGRTTCPWRPRAWGSGLRCQVVSWAEDQMSQCLSMGPCENLMLTLGGRPDRDEGTSRQDLGAAAAPSDHAQGSHFYSNRVLGLALCWMR